MRGTSLALVLFGSACASSAPSSGPSYDSVRERLTDQPTRLYVGAAGSSGSITARRWTSSGWIEGTTPVTIASGELVARIDASGRLAVPTFDVGIEPIELPEAVFGRPAQLSDVRVVLRKPATGAIRWAGDDDATAQLTVELDLHWAIAINNAKTPLGTQHLPPVELAIELTGGGDHVDAAIAVAATGELWSWAGLLELTAIELALAGATVD
jgi:hypothetical protein